MGWIIIIGVILATCVHYDPVQAHSGGLNPQGCHAGLKPYHCHEASGRTNKSASKRSRRGNDKNCSDFSSWRAAQRFFESQDPGDPHRLDADRDAIACVSLRVCFKLFERS